MPVIHNTVHAVGAVWGCNGKSFKAPILSHPCRGHIAVVGRAPKIKRCAIAINNDVSAL